MERTGTVVVGGGATGALAAIHLLRAGGHPVTLVDPGDALGTGIAYRTTDPGHLLNSRAGSMSAHADDPDHFVRWCARNGEVADRTAFLPRLVYGRYLNQTLRATPGPLRHLRDEVTRVDRTGRLELKRGKEIHADRVVLAFGHARPPRPAAVTGQVARHPRYIADPWRAGCLDRVPLDRPVLLLGSGLTAVDVALSLTARGLRAPLHAISRRGLLPLAHNEIPAPRAELPMLNPPLRDLIRAVRRAAEREPDWRAVVDAVRPRANAVWQGLHAAERDRFLRHVARHWEVHRHRMAPSVARTAGKLLVEGALTLTAGSVSELVPDGAGFVAFARAADGPRRWRVGAVVNCIGPGGATGTPLGHTLLADGVARPGPLRLGLDTDAEGRLVTAAGQALDAVRLVGPPRRGALWETTAVPEIRDQVHAL